MDESQLFATEDAIIEGYNQKILEYQKNIFANKMMLNQVSNINDTLQKLLNLKDNENLFEEQEKFNELQIEINGFSTLILKILSNIKRSKKRINKFKKEIIIVKQAKDEIKIKMDTGILT